MHYGSLVVDCPCFLPWHALKFWPLDHWAALSGTISRLAATTQICILVSSRREKTWIRLNSACLQFHMVDLDALLLFSILANASVVGLLAGHMICPGVVCIRPRLYNFVIESVITHFPFSQDVVPLLSGTFGLSVHWGGVPPRLGTVAALSLLSLWWLDWFPRIRHGNYHLSTDTQLDLFCRFFRH